MANAFTSGLRGSPVSVALSSFPVMPEIDVTPQQYRGRLSLRHRAFQWCLVIFGYELLSVGKGHDTSVEEIGARLALHESLFDGLPSELRPDIPSLGPVTLGDGTTVTRAEDLPAAFQRRTSEQQLTSLMALKGCLGPQQYQAVAARLIPYIRGSRKG